MKKIKFFIPLLLGGLVLAGCESASDLKDIFSDEDLVINTPWQDFVMPAIGVEFAEGEDSIELNKGETHAYKYEIQPRGATNNSLTWTSADESVATVSGGVVTAVGGGETTISVGGVDTVFNDSELSVKVNVPLVDFSLEVPSRLEWDEKYTFTPTCDPIDTTYRKFSYEVVNPSTEGLVSVNENGEVSTGSVNGTATLRVTSEFLGADKAKDYPLVIQTIPVESIELSTENNVDEVEINNNLQINAKVNPTDASDYVRKGVKFYSRDPEIATVDEVTGVVTGISVSASPARIYAKVGSVESADFSVTVFRVLATSVAFSESSVEINNSGQTPVLTKQLEWEITTDRPDLEPSSAAISFVSDDESVATVSDSGLVTAVGAGSANVSIVIKQDGVSDVEASIPVNVDFVSKTLVITAGSSLYNDDEPMTLTATLAPASVTNPTINWSIDNEEIAQLDSTTGSSVKLSAKDSFSVGEVKVTATNVGGASSTVTVNIADRVVGFTAGERYIVGNHIYSSGKSVTHGDISSWGNAKHAYHFTNCTVDNDEKTEFKGTIYFEEGDEFRYRIGDNWIPAWEQQEGWDDRGYHIENNGALTDGSMHFADIDNPENTNIVVDEEGYYDLYAKLLKDNDWIALYITKVPDMSSEVTDFVMGLSDEYQIVLHDYIGDVSYEVSNSSVIDVSNTGLITAKAEGKSTVTVTDERNCKVYIHVEIKDGASGISRLIYLNANGKLDQGTPYVHSWVDADPSQNVDVKMNKVAGQDIIYVAAINIDHDSLLFADSKVDTGSIDFEKIYSKTEDLALENGKDMFIARTDTGESVYTGVWSVFDSSVHYEVEIQAPYIFYSDGGPFVREQLVVNPGNTKEVMGSVTLPLNGEFVVCLTDEIWLHYENLKGGSASEVGEGSLEGDVHNFKATVPGTYILYVDTESHEVYVGFTGDFTVSFDGNGGSGSMASVPHQTGDYELPGCTFTAPSGKAFGGWKADGEGTAMLAGASYHLSGDVTFVAQWKDEANNVTIYLTANWGWTSPKAYVYDTSTGDTPKAAWPGEDMTYVGVNDDNDTIFSYTVDVNTYDMLVFSNGLDGNENQTVDIDISEAIDGSAFFFKGREGDEHSKITVETWSYTPEALTSKRLVYFSNNKSWDNPHFYVFNSSTKAKEADWPGNDAKYVGLNEFNEPVYRVAIDTTSYDSFIFNGSGGQSVDIALSSLGEGKNAFYLLDTQNEKGYYNVGQWAYTPA